MAFAFLFWPALALAVAVSILGIVYRAPGLLVAGAVLAIPGSLYLAATPGFGPAALLLPLLHVAGAYILRKNEDRPWVAAVPLLVFAGIFGWLGLEIAF